MAKPLGLPGQKRRSKAKRDSTGRYATVANSVGTRQRIRSLRQKMKRVGRVANGRERSSRKNIYADNGSLKGNTTKRRRR